MAGHIYPYIHYEHTALHQ